MFDVGWTELLLIGIVALIVVGPEDLPRMFHTLGRFTAKAKAMAREFQNSMDEAAREAGVDDIASDLRKATSTKSLGLDKLSEAADKFEKWEPGSHTAKLADERADASQKVLDTDAIRDPGAPKPEAGASKPAAKPKARASAKPKAARKAKPKASVKSKATVKSKASASAKAGSRTKPAAIPGAKSKHRAAAKPAESSKAGS